MRYGGLMLLGCIALVGAWGFSPQSGTSTLKKITEFDLPGPGGRRFDYLTIDPEDHYLISAHLAAGQTYVIDLRTNKVVATITDTPGAEGIEYVPELKKFYTSNAGDNTIGVVDLRQMKVIKKLHTKKKPDGSAYAAPFHAFLRVRHPPFATRHFLIDGEATRKIRRSLPQERPARETIELLVIQRNP